MLVVCLRFDGRVRVLQQGCLETVGENRGIRKFHSANTRGRIPMF